MTDLPSLLGRELGADRVLVGPERLFPYSHDESGLAPLWPECAVLVRSREEIALLLRLARELRFPVTPRGAGTGMSGGALAARGGVVLSTERMTRIVSIDADDLLAVVEPGVILEELHRQVEAQGLFYPPDPASLASCSLGGNVAENAGGPRAFKYGTTREYVLGLEVGLMGGELLRFGRRSPKGVTGYDLCGAFVGSEGTFGVTTEITLRLLPRPQGCATLIALFPSVTAAAQGIAAVLRRGYRPCTLELLDRETLEHVRKKAPQGLPAGAGGLCLIELDGDAAEVEAGALRCAEACEQAGAHDVLVARDESERRRLWQARRLASPSLREAHRTKVSEDVAVPRGAIPELLRRLEPIGVEHGLTVATFGHAGDGNLHVNFLSDDPDVGEVTRRIERAVRRLFEETLALGGTLSGEHGIGLSKKEFLALEQSPSLIEWQRRLKRLWDPDDLLNPGKIFP